MSETLFRPTCLLLIGPTGSGKTPLGWAAEKAGVWDFPCVHFDFGAYLRLAAESPNPEIGFSREESDTVSRVLKTGELLNPGDFGIARKIFLCFLKMNGRNINSLVILNGLPRHVEQAENMAELADIRGVVELICSPSVVYSRIGRDAGGDRSGRTDDSIMEIKKKLDIYKRQTRPLVDYYRNKMIFHMVIKVTASMSPEQMLEKIESRRKIGLSFLQ